MSVAQAVGELERITTVLASCGGRDKFMRLVDYQMRAITYFMSQASPKHPQLANLNAFGAHLMFVLPFLRVPVRPSHLCLSLFLQFGSEVVPIRKNIGVCVGLY